MPGAAASFGLAGKSYARLIVSQTLPLLCFVRGTPPTPCPPSAPKKENKKEYNDIIVKMFSCVLCANMATDIRTVRLKELARGRVAVKGFKRTAQRRAFKIQLIDFHPGSQTFNPLIIRVSR